MKRVLIIAGSDSGGGAGIQADLKTVSAFGAWGSTVVTALTAQNTQGVKSIHPVPPSFVAEQIKAVLEDIGADSVKVGMLGNAEVVHTVAELVRGLRPIVVDPVMIAKGGARLLEPQAVSALKSELLPLATVLTPNIPEAEALSGRTIRSIADMESAAESLRRSLSIEAVLIKGGHLEGEEVCDVLVTAEGSKRWVGPRLATRNTHGTGCTLSSALAALLAEGIELKEAAGRAVSFVRLAMKSGPAIGGGHRPLDQLASLKREAQRYAITEALGDALSRLQSLPFHVLVPEVQSNLAFALPFAESPEDVAAFPGRIIKVGKRITAPAPPAFGGSRHVAKVVLTAMRFDPELRCCCNIRYGADVLRWIEQAGLSSARFDRKNEPPEVKAREGATLEWGTAEALRSAGGAVDVIYDEGDIGKEPMVRVLGTDPASVVEKIEKILAASHPAAGT